VRIRSQRCLSGFAGVIAMWGTLDFAIDGYDRAKAFGRRYDVYRLWISTFQKDDRTAI
jgi:hypothetical protein